MLANNLILLEKKIKAYQGIFTQNLFRGELPWILSVNFWQIWRVGHLLSLSVYSQELDHFIDILQIYL